MSDPKRLLSEDDAGSLEKAMLASWRTEGPSPAARDKTLAALGLGTGIAATGAAAGSIAPKAMTGVAVLAKWLTVALVVGAVSTAIVVVRSRTTVEAPPPAAPTLRTAAPPIAPVDVTPAIREDVPAVEASSLPVVPAPTRQHASHNAAPADLSPQIALLDRARSSVAEGDGAEALDLVRRYRAAYPGGAFEQEADVVEIEALEKKGDDAGAKSAARRFLAAHPSSPHAAQVRSSAGL